MLYLDKIVSVLSIAIIIGVSLYLYLEFKKKFNSMSSNNFSKNLKKEKYPDCPNFFEIINEGDQKMCKNIYQLGKCNIAENNKISAFFNDKDPFFTDNQRGDLRKCLWAKECDVSWDGIDRLC